MATIETVYLGELRTEATHTQSGSRIITDAPTDNNGRGEAFSPTDMVAAALGSCMLTIMDLSARRMGIDLNGTRVSITKTMASDPRRIEAISADFYIPAEPDDKQRVILERSADTCPVAKSLHPELRQVMNFHYGVK